MNRLDYWWAKVFGPTQNKSAGEGQYRPGPYTISDGWLSSTAGRLMNWWQCGYSLQPYGTCNAMVEACVSAYSQTIAMCPGGHWRSDGNGGRTRVTTSALSRIVKRPNPYQSMSDFLLNLTRRVYEKGEAFAVAVRNDRFEITELHLMRHGYPYVGDDGSIFYSLRGNDILERRFDFSLPRPAREVLHVRLHTPRNDLKGESPILATALDLAMSGAALNQQIAFYLNQARPSFLLETDQQLTRDQTLQLRQLWNEQTQGENAGGTPILTWGLKANPVTTTASDSMLADMLRMTNEKIALAYRIPLQVLGIGNTPFASTEALMSSWRASGLGFALNHIEEAFGLLFGLQGQPEEYLEFDTDALLRSNFKELVEGLARSTISGIHSPDEARAAVSLPSVPGGHGAMPRVQQQVVPLSYGSDLQPPKPKPTPAGPAQATPAPEEPAKGLERPINDNERIRRAFRASNARHADLAA